MMNDSAFRLVADNLVFFLPVLALAPGQSPFLSVMVDLIKALDLGIETDHLEGLEGRHPSHPALEVKGLPLVDRSRQTVGFFPVEGEHQAFFGCHDRSTII